MSSKPRGKQESIETDVILVIKGAGSQELDSTLDTFLGGFIPAMRQYDPEANIRIGRESTMLKEHDYKSFYKEKEKFDQKVVEITSHKAGRRIWIKEAYWEPLIKESGPLTALLREWGLAAFSVRKLLEDFWFPWYDGKRYDKNGKLTRNLNATKNTARGYWLYFFCAYLLVLAFLGLTGVWGETPLESGLGIERACCAAFTQPQIWWQSIVNMLSWIPPTLRQLGLGALAVAAVAALGPAVQSARRKKEDRRMPGLGNWVLVALGAAMLLQPGSYLVLLLLYFLLGVGLILAARRLAWRWRPTWYTDTPVTYETNPQLTSLYLDRRLSRLARLTQLVYRLYVALAVPAAVLILLLAKLFRVLNLFTPQGVKIDEAISGFVMRFLGDVTTYAMEPAQAAAVQSLVEYDINTFAKLTGKGDAKTQVVDRIHLYAHSQGTPITFEVYLRLDDEVRQKVRTLLTIGSVLNLHNQVNQVLDEHSWDRFPPKRGYPAENKLNSKFKWFNFWNFTDPITQFTGLEAYRYASPKKSNAGQILYQRDGTPKKKFHKASPFSIKTRESLLKNHAEYWTNVKEIHYPFIKHIFNQDPKIWLPDEWLSPDLQKRQKERTWKEDEFDQSAHDRRKFIHGLVLLVIWLLLFGGAVALGMRFWQPFTTGLGLLVQAVGAGLGGLADWLTGLLRIESNEEFWGTVKGVYVSQALANGVGAVILAWGALSSLAGLWPGRRGAEERGDKG